MKTQTSYVAFPNPGQPAVQLALPSQVAINQPIIVVQPGISLLGSSPQNVNW